MFSYSSFCENRLNRLRDDGRYRYFNQIERSPKAFPHAIHHYDGIERNIIIWCSNDYLAMGQHPDVLQAMCDVIMKNGGGSGGTRNISGSTHLHYNLEQDLANLHQKEASLLFTSGYVANMTTLKTLGDTMPNCQFYSDQKNHNSMIVGMKRSKGNTHIFAHNTISDLDKKLAETPKDIPKIVVWESVYSMDGTISPIHDIIDVAQKHNALTYIDEVHAVGLYGDHGAGMAEQVGAMERIDIIQGTLAKGVGQIGGYIASSDIITDYVRSFGQGFIFTTSLPPHVVAGAKRALSILKHDSARRQKLQDNVAKLKQRLHDLSIPTLPSECHIIPILIGNANLCKQVSDRLLYKHCVYVQPINYPTVDVGTERLRVTISPLHDDGMIDHFIDALMEAWQHFGLKHG